MDKKTRKKVKNYILGGIAVAAVALLALLPTLTASGEDGAELVILSGTAQTGRITESLAGGGTLTGQKGVAVSVPSGVEVTEYLVKNGDMVSEGDPVARVDRVSVMTAITETQEKLDELRGKIEDADVEELQEDTQRYITEYLWLTEDHRIYESVLEELFALYRDSTVRATASGRVSGVDGNALTPVAYGGQDMRIALLSAEMPADNSELETEAPTETDDPAETSTPTETDPPNETDDPAETDPPEATDEPGETDPPQKEYVYQVGMVVAVDDNGAWTLSVQPDTSSVTDHTGLGEIDTLVETMTASASYIPDAPIYSVAGESRTQIGAGRVKAGDVLVFVSDGEKILWIDIIGHYDIPGTNEDTDNASGEMGDPTGGTTGTPDTSGFDISSFSAGSFSGLTGMSGMTGMSGLDISSAGGLQDMYPNAAMQGQQAVEEALQKTVLSVIPQDTMTVQITIDELDISRLAPGQTADITVDALPGFDFEGVIVQVGGSAQNAGGNTKYPVTILMDRMDLMLEGMNASATIALSVKEDVLTVPVAALYDDGADRFVYTSYDESSGTLGDPVYVTTGASDGLNVEILSGLSVGDTYWYSYYDSLS